MENRLKDSESKHQASLDEYEYLVTEKNELKIDYFEAKEKISGLEEVLQKMRGEMINLSQTLKVKDSELEE